jgi:N-acetylneuraminic acid mutarotase
MISHRSEGHALTRLADGRVLVVGGWGLQSAELFDPDTGQWSAADGMLARNNPMAVLLSDGRVLVAGGDHGAQSGTYEMFSWAELYDPRTGVWTATGSMIEGRSGASATLLPDGRVLVTGGRATVPHAGGSHVVDLASAELYDPATGTWSSIAPMGGARAGHTATLLCDGRVLVVGSSKAELYDPGTGAWTRTADMIDDREFHTATLLNDGTVLVAGGVVFLSRLVSTELYDPASGSWTATGRMVESRAWHTATLLLDGKVLLTGGGDGGYGGQSSAEVYDPETRSWSATPNMLSPRGWHEAVALADGRVLVVGGYDGRSGPDLDAEVFDPAND